jgi:PKD repeat protein
MVIPSERMLGNWKWLFTRLTFTGSRTVSERGNESLVVPEEALITSSVQQNTVTTEMPATTTQQSFWFWNRLAAKAEPPNAATDSTETTAATSAQVTTEATDMTTDSTEEPSVEITTASNMVVVRDSDHEDGAFNASGINPFSTEVNGNIYKYLLVKMLNGLNSKWKLYHVERSSCAKRKHRPVHVLQQNYMNVLGVIEIYTS